MQQSLREWLSGLMVHSGPDSAMTDQLPVGRGLRAATMFQPLERVSFWPRFGATAIDYVIVAAICATLGATLGGLSHQPIGESVWGEGVAGDPYLGALAGIVAGFALVGALYMSIEAWANATPGKRLLGLVVVSEDGRPAPTGVRVARYLVKNCHLLLGSASSLSGAWFIGALAPLATLVVVAGSTMILTPERRALHDIVAKTAVVGRPPRSLNS